MCVRECMSVCVGGEGGESVSVSVCVCLGGRESVCVCVCVFA